MRVRLRRRPVPAGDPALERDSPRGSSGGDAMKATASPRPGPEHLAGQHHARPARQRDGRALRRGAFGDGADLEPDHLQPGHQEQRRLRRRDPRGCGGRQVRRGALLRPRAPGPHARGRHLPADLGPDEHGGRLGLAGGVAPPRVRHEDTLAAARELFARAKRRTSSSRSPGRRKAFPPSRRRSSPAFRSM